MNISALFIGNKHKLMKSLKYYGLGVSKNDK